VDSDNVLAKLSLICGYLGLVFRVAFKNFTGFFAIKKLLGDFFFNFFYNKNMNLP